MAFSLFNCQRLELLDVLLQAEVHLGVVKALRHLSSTEGLVEEVSPDGGTVVNLQGRFQTTTVAVIGEDGKVIVKHGSDFLKDDKEHAEDASAEGVSDAEEVTTE